MELRRLWRLIWNRKLLVLVLVVAAVAAGYESTPKQARYQTAAILFVGVPEYSSAGVFSNDLLLGQEQAAVTFATMVPELSVAQNAVAASGVPRSAGQVVSETTAGVVPGTSLIKVTVTDSDPVIAETLANAMSQAFVAEIQRIDPVTSNITGQRSSAAAPVSISQQAVLPVVPLNDGLKRNLILSGLFGLLFAIGLVFLLDYLDLSVRTPEDLERHAGLPVLGLIPLYSELPTHDHALPGSQVLGVRQLSGGRDG